MYKILKILFLFLVNAAHGLRTCTIISPEFVHADRKFSISLAVHNLNASSQFEVTIESVAFKDYQIVELQPNGVQIVEFHLPNLPKDEYVLHVEGENGIYAKFSTTLKFAKYKPIFALQTDKRAYLCGETLYYRLLCLNEDLRPIKPESAVDVRVTTGDHRLVANMANLTFAAFAAKGEIFLNCANFDEAKTARLAVFSEGELQAAANIAIITAEEENGDENDFIDLKQSKLEAHQTDCNEHNFNQFFHSSSLVNSKVVEFTSINATQVTFFNVELDQGLQGKRIKQSDLAVFRIISQKAFGFFIYTIVGRGRILSSKRIDLEIPTHEYMFNLKPLNEMAPLSKLIVYFIDEADKFYYDEAVFNVEGILENELKLSTPTLPKQNEKVQFHIQTAKHSYIGILAVEESFGDKKCVDEHPNDLNINELLNFYGLKNKLQRGEFTGSLILTTARNFEYKTKAQQKTWLERRQMDLDRSINKNLTETWFFAEITNTTDSDFILTHNLPNANATWRITAFALNKLDGLAFAELQTLLQTQKSYNITFDMPRNLHAREAFVLNINVENFLNESIAVKVEFMPDIYDIEVLRISENFVSATRNLNIAPKTNVKLKYFIRTRTAGRKKFKFLFFSKAGNDRQIVKLNVKEQGLSYRDEIFKLIDLRNNSTYEQLVWPSKSYKEIFGMRSSSIDIYTNLFQPILEYFIRNKVDVLNCQTSEQLISIMALAKLSLEFLQSTNVEPHKFETVITRKMHLAFMALLDYRVHQNGGFKFFINDKNREESIWLTAYILRWLPSLDEYFNVNETIMEMGYEFLTQSQNENGSFVEKGLSLNKISGNDSLALTAHVLWAFLEQKNVNDSHKQLVEKSLNYVIENLPQSENLYAKALALHVLNKAGLQGIKQELLKLDANSWIAMSDDGYKFWAEGVDTDSNNVAITALLLLTRIKVNAEESDILPCLRWLIEKGKIYNFINSLPTHAAVLGIEAVLHYALSIKNDLSMDLTFGHQGLFKMDFQELALKSDETKHRHSKFKAQDSSLKIQATGGGLALAVVCYDYSIHIKPDADANFIITYEKPNKGLSISFEIAICLTYEGIKEAADLTVLNFEVLSGYEVQEGEIKNLVNSVDFIKHATKKGSALEFLLLGLKRNTKKCFKMELQRVRGIAKQIDVPISCYEQVDSSKLSMTSYGIETSLCDLCNGEEVDCKKNC